MKILFVAHNNSNTGAPKSLGIFVKWFKAQSASNIAHSFYKWGENESKVYDHVYSYEDTLVKGTSVFRKALNFTKISRLIHYLAKRQLIRRITKEKYDLIYFNTIVNKDLVRFLSSVVCRKIVHVRELNSSIEHYGGRALVELHKANMDRFITITNAVKDNLINEGVDSDKIVQINNHIEINEPNKSFRNDFRKKYGIPADAFVVGGAGSLIWRKGPDLFVNLCAAYKNNMNVYFVWYGGDDTTRRELMFDIEKLGMRDRFIFDGFNSSESIDYFSVFDVHFLSSREEPFGLTGLEAALNEVPIICFENGGGQPEFVSRGAGVVVPYLDLQEVFQQVEFWRLHKEERNEVGNTAKQIVIDKYAIEKVGPQLLRVLQGHD